MTDLHVYLSAEELEQRAAARLADADKIAPGHAKQSILKDAAQLRSYADMQRWLTSDALKPPKR
jgi:hypothetical protein